MAPISDCSGCVEELGEDLGLQIPPHWVTGPRARVRHDSGRWIESRSRREARAQGPRRPSKSLGFEGERQPMRRGLNCDSSFFEHRRRTEAVQPPPLNIRQAPRSSQQQTALLFFIYKTKFVQLITCFSLSPAGFILSRNQRLVVGALTSQANFPPSHPSSVILSSTT